MNTEKNRRVKDLILHHNGLKLPQKQMIPEYTTHADIVIVGINGEGIFSIGGKQTHIIKGIVIHLKLNTKYATTATTDLELIVNHMQLNPVELNCGSPSCSHD